MNYSGGWRFYDSVSLSGGKRLKLKQIDRSVDSCTSGICRFTEHVLLHLPDNYLKENKDLGIKYRINAQKTSTGAMIDIPSAYIHGFLVGIQQN